MAELPIGIVPTEEPIVDGADELSVETEAVEDSDMLTPGGKLVNCLSSELKFCIPEAVKETDDVELYRPVEDDEDEGPKRISQERLHREVMS